MSYSDITFPLEQFPQLFTGLGKLPGLYTIKLSDTAKPFSLHVLPRVAVPLMEAVKQVQKNKELWLQFWSPSLGALVW